MTATVLVVCDNPKHARGKVSKIAEYTVSDEGEVGVRFHVLRERSRRVMSRAARAAAHAFDGSSASSQQAREAAKAVMRGVNPGPQCKLCGRKLPADSPNLSREICRLAEAGATSVSLSDLVSRVRNQEQQ